MNAKKKVGKAVESQREVERQARIAALERQVAERDRSVASREASGEKEKSARSRSPEASRDSRTLRTKLKKK
jgi:hypothetical protein